jgi:hypothetical protein
MKIPPVESELFREDGRTDRQTNRQTDRHTKRHETNIRFSQFCEGIIEVFFYYFSDRASRCKSFTVTNLIHIRFILQYVYYIIHLDMFRAQQCPSSGGPNCFIHLLVYHSLLGTLQHTV